jgi:protein-disulfide isomerase
MMIEMMWNRSLFGIVAGALVGIMASPAISLAEPQEGISRQQADAILGELREIRLLLEKMNRLQVVPPAAVGAPPPPVNVMLKVGPETPMMGDKNAPLTMVEFIDLQCSFCKKFDENTFAEIRRNLIDTGKVRYFSRDYPLDFHPFAMKAAVAAHCAAEQGQFWRMREVLVTNAANLASDAILGYAKAAGLDTNKFQSCFESTKYDAPIRASVREGASIGVAGTPSFLLGKSTPEGVSGTLLVGALPYATYDDEIKKLLAK